ncbi:MAG: YceI family protein [Pseudobdellovibrionaceae bacterium]
MKSLMTAVFFLVSTICFAQVAKVDIKLRPAGSFKVESTEVKGFAVQKGNMVEAKNILVGLKKLKTGINLRDEHTRKHLQVDKYPDAVLVSAKGQGGKGEGLLRIRGIEKKISGTYKVEGSTLMAEFPIKLSDFEITGIKYMGVGVDDNAKVKVSIPIKN